MHTALECSPANRARGEAYLLFLYLVACLVAVGLNGPVEDDGEGAGIGN